MPLVIVTSEIDPKFFKLGQFSGYQIGDKDYDAKVEIADIYKFGGRELRAEEFAQSLDLSKIKSEDKVPGFFATENGGLVVSEQFKNMIENADPNLHQFNQVKLTNNKSPMSEKAWYVLNVWRRFESIDLEQSATKEVKGFDRKVKTKLDVRKKKIVLQKNLNVDCNLWRDEKFPSMMFVHDDFANALNKEKFLKNATTFQTSDS